VLKTAPTESMVFTIWCVTLGFAARHLPLVWQRQLRYEITEKHVVYRRGRFRRTIERSAISFARIYWHPDHPAVGDLELVRAVPTGALRRRLLLRLRGLAAPDRVWSLIRGTDSRSEGTNSARRAISQRLDQGEHVLWSSSPVIGWRRFLPSGRRNWRTLALGALIVLLGLNVTVRLVRNLVGLMDAGLSEHPGALAALIVGEVCAI